MSIDSITVKYCGKCNTTKPISEFHQHKRKDNRVRARRSDSENYRYRIEYCCKNCNNKYKREWNLRRTNEDPEFAQRWKKYRRDWKIQNKINNPEKVAEQTKRYESSPGRKLWRKNWQKGWKERRKFYIMASSSIQHHRKDGINVEITADELEKIIADSTHCVSCGIEFGPPGSGWKTRSIDRIDNHNTMNVGNIRIICQRCNTMKGNLPLSEFVEYCKRIIGRA